MICPVKVSVTSQLPSFVTLIWLIISHIPTLGGNQQYLDCHQTVSQWLLEEMCSTQHSKVLTSGPSRHCCNPSSNVLITLTEANLDVCFQAQGILDCNESFVQVKSAGFSHKMKLSHNCILMNLREDNILTAGRREKD